MLKKIVNYIGMRPCPLKEFWIKILEGKQYEFQYFVVNLPTQHWIRNEKELLQPKSCEENEKKNS